MARGRNAIRFQPIASWTGARPTDVEAGQAFRHDFYQPEEERSRNVYVSRRGLVRVRPGYGIVLDVPRNILAIYSRSLATEGVQYVVTATEILEVAGNTIVQTYPDPVAISLDTLPWQIIQLGFEAERPRFFVLGNELSAPLKKFVPNVGYNLVTTADFGELRAYGMAVVGGRIVLVNTYEAGQRTPERIRWSQALDGTEWPPLNFIDVYGLGEAIAIANLTQNDAIVYYSRGAVLLTAQAGLESEAFTARVLSNDIVPPVRQSALAAVENSHYYIGIDNQIYVTGYESSAQISGLVAEEIGRIALSYESPFRLVAYEPTEQAIYCFFGGEGETFTLRFDVQRKLLAPPWFLPELITALDSLVVETKDPWFTDLDPWDTPTGPWREGAVRGFSPGFTAGVGLRGERGPQLVHLFGNEPTDNDAGIDWVVSWHSASMQDPRFRITPDTIDIDGIRVPVRPGDETEVSVRLFSKKSPYALSRTPVLRATIDLNDESKWRRPLDPVLPGALDGSAMIPSNYLELTIQGYQFRSRELFAFVSVLGNVSERTDEFGVQL
jgi:hypothetical protein